MTIAYVGAGAFALGTGSLVASPHVSTSEGDLLLARAQKRGGTDTIATPSGWALIYTNDSTDAGVGYVFAKLAGAAEGSTTFTVTGTTAGMVQIATFSHAGISNLAGSVNVTAWENVAFGGGSLLAPTITPTIDGAAVIFMGQHRDTGENLVFGALAGTTEIGQDVSGTTSSLGMVWNYVIQGTAAQLSPGSWSLTGLTANNGRKSFAIAIVEDSATRFLPVVQPLYYGTTLLASKSNLLFKITKGSANLIGNTLGAGTNGTTDASGNFVLPAEVTLQDDDGPITENDPAFLHLYWEEGTNPVVDRSLIVKTTLVAEA